MTYGLVENASPANDPTFRGEVTLCELEEGKVSEFDAVTKEVELPSSPLKVPAGYHRRDCQDWVAAVLKLAVERTMLPGEVEEKLDGIPKLILLES